jgi:hypothetical protein
MAFPMKRMKHPEHGFHHVSSPQEEEVMRSNGWVDDDTPAAKPAPVVEPAPAPAPAPGRKAKR